MLQGSPYLPAEGQKTPLHSPRGLPPSLLRTTPYQSRLCAPAMRGGAACTQGLFLLGWQNAHGSLEGLLWTILNVKEKL